MLVTAFYLTVLVWSAIAEDDFLKGTVDENGILNINPPGQSMEPFGGAYPMISPNYPEPAPNKLKRQWRFVSYSEKKTALKVICYDLRLPKLSCDEYSFTIEDGDRNHVYCGEAGPFTIITDTDDIRGILRNGPNGKAYVNCTAEGVLVGQNHEELTTPKPTPTKPPKLSYLTDASEEINSEEHGGPTGAKSTTCPCGWANKVSSRIVNGTETAPNEFPFAAALVEKDTLWNFCGATIITAWHALTAAHCTVFWKQGMTMAIIVGEHDLTDDANNEPSKVIGIQNIVDHQGYSEGRHVDDISLLILEEEIIFSRQVGPACLPTHQYDLTKKYVKIIGWGKLYQEGPSSDVLMNVDVRVVDRGECNYMYSSVKKDNPTQICTFAKRKGACQGDSGGPVVWVDPETNRYTLVGVVSFGRYCADASPSVHTDVAAYLAWIQHFVKVSKHAAQICYKKD